MLLLLQETEEKDSCQFTPKLIFFVNKKHFFSNFPKIKIKNKNKN
jgi:hypothetical protein